MTGILQLAMAFTLRPDIEGGWTPIDGGTMHGVTQAVYDNYRLSIDAPMQSVRNISQNEVTVIMFSRYWKPAQCDLLPAKVAIAHFDAAYNEGVSGAIRVLQAALGVAQDGVIGEQTQRAIAGADPVALLADYLDARVASYRRIATEDPAKTEYLAGWLNRVDVLGNYLETANG